MPEQHSWQEDLEISFCFFLMRHFYFFSEGSKAEGMNKSQSDKQFLWSRRKRGGEGHSFLFIFFNGLSSTGNILTGRRQKKVRLGLKKGGESNGK